MHELTIAQNVFEIINQSVPADKYDQVESVKIKIGKLANIFPETLLSAFNTIKEDFGLDNIKLIIEEESLQLLCRDCGSRFITDDVIFSCIYCQSSNLEVEGGDKLMVSEIILKEDL